MIEKRRKMTTDRQKTTIYSHKTTIKSHKIIAETPNDYKTFHPQMWTKSKSSRDSLNLKTDRGNRPQTHSDVFLIKSTCLGETSLN